MIPLSKGRIILQLLASGCALTVSALLPFQDAVIPQTDGSVAYIDGKGEAKLLLALVGFGTTLFSLSNANQLEDDEDAELEAEEEEREARERYFAMQQAKAEAQAEMIQAAQSQAMQEYVPQLADQEYSRLSGVPVAFIQQQRMEEEQRLAQQQERQQEIQRLQAIAAANESQAKAEAAKAKAEAKTVKAEVVDDGNTQALPKAEQRLNGDRSPLTTSEIELAIPHIPTIDTSWKNKMVLTNKLVVGKSGSGKTFYLLSDVAEFKQRYPDGRLAIVDVDYGSSHNGQQPNYWFDLPHVGDQKVVFTSVAECLEIIDKFYAELERRATASKNRQQIDKPAWMLVLDELPAIILDLDDNRGFDIDTGERLPSDKEVFISRILQILRRGRKQNIYCSIGSQTLAVESTAIKTDALAQFDQVILGKSIYSRKYLGWLGIKSKEVDDLLAQIEDLATNHERLAVVREDDDIDVRPLPHITLKTIK